MRIGTILPHTKLYGGVRRFLELGNLFEIECQFYIYFNKQ